MNIFARRYAVSIGFPQMRKQNIYFFKKSSARDLHVGQQVINLSIRGERSVSDTLCNFSAGPQQMPHACEQI